MTQEVDQKQRILKAVVIVLGVLLFVCFGIVVITIASRLTKMGKEEAPQTDISEEVAVTPYFGRKTVEIPEGARVGSISADGKTLFLVIDGPDGQEIIVIDHWTGGERGRIKVIPGPE